ncbi:MAG: DNA-binding NarL/FixJ family response regulator [Desulforhopalus sp.]|jgi:DNA-binding NarL/FixJ family response regulator
MMQIQCCTRDRELLDRLIALYGTGNVTGIGDAELLNKDSLQHSDVTIVDLKYTRLPTEKLIASPVVVLTAVPTFPEAFNLLQLGIRGYGNRQMRQSNLKQVIDNVKDGQIWLPPDIISKLIDVVGHGEGQEKTKSRDKLLNTLSKREQEVALFVAKGMSNQEVADKLYVSLRTIKAHLSSIYEKAGVRNRLELGLALA